MHKFPHPNPQVASGKVIPDQPFFLHYPDAKLSIITKATELLKTHDLNVDTVAEYANETLLPRLHQEHNMNVPPAGQMKRCDFLRSLGFIRTKFRQDDSDNDHVSNETTDEIEETDVDATVGKSTIFKLMK